MLARALCDAVAAATRLAEKEREAMHALLGAAHGRWSAAQHFARRALAPEEFFAEEAPDT